MNKAKKLIFIIMLLAAALTGCTQKTASGFILPSDKFIESAFSDESGQICIAYSDNGKYSVVDYDKYTDFYYARFDLAEEYYNEYGSSWYNDESIYEEYVQKLMISYQSILIIRY